MAELTGSYTAEMFLQTGGPGVGDWYPIAGRVDTNSTYIWTGNNTYSNVSYYTNNIVSTTGFNKFLNPAARDAAINGLGGTTVGNIAFLQQDASGNTINQLQYYDGTQWTPAAPRTQINNVAGTSYTITALDENKMIVCSASSSVIISIPTDATLNLPIGYTVIVVQYGAGQVTIAAVTPATTTVNSSNGLRTAVIYAGAQITKVAANSWLVTGNMVP